MDKKPEKMVKSYCIKKGYRCNQVAPYTGTVNNSTYCQAPIYLFAAEVIRKNKLTSVLDIGCGFGLKLSAYIHPICEDIVGIDLSYPISFCKVNHNFGEWFVDNIEKSNLSLHRKFELIIVSDVIEHLADPDKLFEYIERYANLETFIILSTPERNICRGKNSFGPSSNPYHVREWDGKEFSAYISCHGLTVYESFLVGYKNGAKQKQSECQVFLVKRSILESERE